MTNAAGRTAKNTVVIGGGRGEKKYDGDYVCSLFLVGGGGEGAVVMCGGDFGRRRWHSGGDDGGCRRGRWSD